jgi:glycosyltransferase involved in cell wall biosynthesis
MRVLYIHQYFCTRAGRSGTRSYEFARDLVRRGHRVTMLTSTSDLSDVTLAPGQAVGRIDIGGIDVVAVQVEYSQHMSVAQRLWSFMRFMVLSAWIAGRERGHDVVIATSTPLTVGVPGLVASLVHRIPLVFEVRDLWPEAPIQMGLLRNPVLIAALRTFERLVYRRSAHVIALSPGMRDGVLRAGTPAHKISVIPNCSDLDLFQPGDPDPALVAQFGLEGRFVVGYAGSMGEANDVEVLLEAAQQLRDRPEIRFLLVGQGKQAAALEACVRERGLDNIQFGGSLPRQDVARVLRVFDVALVLFKNLPVLAHNSPNKLFDALAAGCPVIVNSNGWTRELVEAHGVGRYAQPGSGASLADEIVWLCERPAARAEMRRAARRLAEADFDRLQLAAEFEAVLRNACGVGGHDVDSTPPAPRERDGAPVRGQDTAPIEPAARHVATVQSEPVCTTEKTLQEAR